MTSEEGSEGRSIGGNMKERLKQTIGESMELIRRIEEVRKQEKMLQDAIVRLEDAVKERNNRHKQQEEDAHGAMKELQRRAARARDDVHALARDVEEMQQQQHGEREDVEQHRDAFASIISSIVYKHSK